MRELHEQPGIALSAQLDKAAQGKFSSLQVDGSDDEAIFWILDNQAVLSAFGPPPMAASTTAPPISGPGKPAP